MAEVLIRHKTTGVEYVIDQADLKRGELSALEDGTPATYERAGFEPVNWHPSGVPFEAGKTEKQTLAAQTAAIDAENAPAPVAARHSASAAEKAGE